VSLHLFVNFNSHSYYWMRSSNPRLQVGRHSESTFGKLPNFKRRLIPPHPLARHV
jgi:hypothetical protein